jgi:hypothetical protein
MAGVRPTLRIVHADRLDQVRRIALAVIDWRIGHGCQLFLSFNCRALGPSSMRRGFMGSFTRWIGAPSPAQAS